MSFNSIEIKVEAQVMRIEYPLSLNLDLSLLSAGRASADVSAPCRGFGRVHHDGLFVHIVRRSDAHWYSMALTNLV